MPCYHPKVKTLGFPAQNLIKIADFASYRWISASRYPLVMRKDGRPARDLVVHAPCVGCPRVDAAVRAAAPVVAAVSGRRRLPDRLAGVSVPRAAETV